jgi:hypothetical protein
VLAIEAHRPRLFASDGLLEFSDDGGVTGTHPRPIDATVTAGAHRCHELFTKRLIAMM